VDDAIGEFLEHPSEESFVSAYRSLYAPLFRYFIVRGLDSFTAEELVQDVLLTVYRRSAEIRNKLCIKGWLYMVARNSLLQHARKQRVSPESLGGGEPVTERFHIAQESELFDWMLVLEDDEREICLMRYMDGLDYQSIAEALQLPIGTVKWKLHQVKNKIAARLRLAKREPKS
jgi:RNA polymerase sigma-70 factor (ECF subfamily)